MLPIQSFPIYTVILPSTDKEINFRPFLVGEEKTLLLAKQSDNILTMLNSLKSVIDNCVISDHNIDDFATFDIEFLFTQIRAKSVGEVVSIIFKCSECTDKKAKVKINLDLTTIKVNKDITHTKIIPLFDDVGIVMKYPSIDIINELNKLSVTDINSTINIIKKCVDYIYNKDEIFYKKDIKAPELDKFIDSLTRAQFLKVKGFFDTMPKLVHDINYECPICKKKHKTKLEGLDAFFS